MAVYEVDPISRIEGHLGVKLTVTDGKVSGADVHGNLWRGFENFLLGRDVNDAITFTQRICGVCPVPHGLTASYTADAALGYSRGHITFAGPDSAGYGVPPKAVHIRNIVLAAEMLMSSITHFYHLTALDYVQGPKTPPWTPFFDSSFYHTKLLNPSDTDYDGTSTSDGVLPAKSTNGFSTGLWDAAVTQYVKALRIRRVALEAGALFAGRMPMTSCFVAGGVTNDGQENLSGKLDKFKKMTAEVREFIVKEYVPLALALGALYDDYDNKYNNNVPNAATAPDVGNYEGNDYGFGAGCGNFLSWGAYPEADNLTMGAKLQLPGGVKITKPLEGRETEALSFTVTTKQDVYNRFLGDDGGASSVENNLTETIKYARYGIADLDTAVYDADEEAFPGDVRRTKPQRDKADAYTYSKGPRWNGYPCEGGPLARLVVGGLYPVDGTPLRNTLGSATLGVDGYDAYVKTYNHVGNPATTPTTPPTTTTGLAPAMIAADLAVACVRDGLATLTIDFNFYGTPWQSAVEGLLSLAPGALPNQVATYTVNAAILAALEAVDGSITGAAYGLDSAVITGAVANWVYGLKGGLSVMDRIRARALESLVLVQLLGGKVTDPNTGWNSAASLLSTAAGSTWRDKVPPTGATKGYGATEVPRGSLAHFVSRSAQGKIDSYQCVVPTTWNISPRDADENLGPMEAAMIGVPYSMETSEFKKAGTGVVQETHSQVEALRVAHTFDPCIACAVH
ncbi:MAG: nickel-dependent hydrogenase large subunit [Clostridiales bacterium]|nr:nickel-dependent hydrogenase large subunit [Clostridiales bacterium]